MAISAEQRVWVGEGAIIHFLGPDTLREKFEIYLVADSRAGRDDAEVMKCFLAPTQKTITLAVAFKLLVNVTGQRIGPRVNIHHDRVIDYQVNGNDRIDLLGPTAEPYDAVAHRGQINHCWNARQVLHENAGGTEGNLFFRVPGSEPLRDRSGGT